MDLEGLRALAMEAVDAADAVTLARFGGRQDAARKRDGSLVTAADREAEAVLRERLGAATPRLPILGEEEGGSLDPATPTWVLDPIDATNNFVRGIPVYATLVALVENGHAVVGVASAPAMGERWDAAAGLGARRNGETIRVSDVASLAQAQVLHGGLDWWRRSDADWAVLGRLADAAWRTRGFGDFWMHLLVAGGMAEVAVERDLEPWDVAAVECIVGEAGGRVTAFDGGAAIAAGEALTTNGRLHGAVQALLAG